MFLIIFGLISIHLNIFQPEDWVWLIPKGKFIYMYLISAFPTFVFVTDVRSRVRVGDGYSGKFGVGFGVHQGSVLSPLLFITVLEALSREFHTSCPWELLYTDDLMISAGSFEELLVKLKTWKRRGLWVNMGKTKIMVSGIDLNLLKKSRKDSCGVCQKEVGSNAIFCGGCLCWIHKKCSDIKGPLRPNSDFRYTRCLGATWPINGRII